MNPSRAFDLVGPDPVLTDDLREGLSTVEARLREAVKSDYPVVTDTARHLVEAIPGMRFELLEGVGHCPQLEAAPRFCEILLDVTGAATRV